MNTLKTYKQDTKPAVLIIGPPGSGKTTMGCCFPNPYVLELDNNIDGPFSFLTSLKMSPNVRYDLPLIREGKLVPPAERYTRIGQCLNNAIKTDPGIETIVISSLTMLAQIAMDETFRVTKLNDPKTPSLADIPKDGLFFHESLKDNTVDAAPRIQDWGTYGRLLNKFFTALRGCGKIIVCCAHVDVDYNEVDTSWRYFIKCPGNFKTEISGMFTDCWYTERESKLSKDGIEHKFMITTVPIPTKQDLGLKSGLQLPKKFEFKPSELSQNILKTITPESCPIILPSTPTKAGS